MALILLTICSIGGVALSGVLGILLIRAQATKALPDQKEERVPVRGKGGWSLDL